MDQLGPEKDKARWWAGSVCVFCPVILGSGLWIFLGGQGRHREGSLPRTGGSFTIDFRLWGQAFKDQLFSSRHLANKSHACHLGMMEKDGVSCPKSPSQRSFSTELPSSDNYAFSTTMFFVVKWQVMIWTTFFRVSEPQHQAVYI